MAQTFRSHKSVFGLFQTQSELEATVTQLKERGFTPGDISIVMPKGDYAQNIAHENQTKAPEGATIGATSGLVLGGALGWLIGAGALAVTGFGPLVAAGPLLAALAGASIGGTIGGIGGALIGVGIPEYEAKKYESALRSGGILIAIHVDDKVEEDRAKQILESGGAHDIACFTDKAEARTYKTMDIPPKSYQL